MGVASGCGCKEVYRFPHITYVYISLLLLYPLFFAAASLLFVHLKNVFRFCSGTFLIYVIKKFEQYKHTYV